jgi:malate dehydrogenase (oxaloacetate-decarboxylating)(NADP+)
MLFPPQSTILEVEIQTAVRVARLIFAADLARVEPPADLEAFIRQQLYTPEYRPLV